MSPSSGWPAWSLLGQAGVHARDRISELHIAVLFGGTSSERQVSLQSGEGMLRALQEDSELQPGSVRGVEIQADGQWKVDGKQHSPLGAVASLREDTVFLLALHGGEGEGGTLQGFLNTCNRMHTGAGLAASALCLDKVRSRQVCLTREIPLAPGLDLSLSRWQSHKQECIEQVLALGPGPWFLKPSLGGSSVSMSLANNPGELERAMDGMPELMPGESILVEQAIKGVEVTQSVMGQGPGQDEPQCLPLVEITPKGDRWFDFEQKYTATGADEFCPPKNVGEPRQLEVAKWAREAWSALGLTSYARLDFIVPKEGPPILLEANTLPGFTSRSLFPMSAEAAGIPYRELCLELCLRARKAQALQQGMPQA